MLLLIVFDKFQLGFTTRAIKIAIPISSSPEAIHITQYTLYLYEFVFFNFLENPRTINAHMRYNMYSYQLYIYTYIKIVGWYGGMLITSGGA